MNFRSHLNLIGKHAFLSASDYHWINYDEDKLSRVFFTKMAAIRGTELHALAHDLIRLGVKLPDNGTTLSMYVNDAIGYRMTPEQPFYYSDNCFGCADAAVLRANKLRIHDLKTGITPASEQQVNVYDAIACLEYDLNPLTLEIENRIYQNDEIHVWVPDPDLIMHLMDKIKTFDRQLNELRLEAQ